MKTASDSNVTEAQRYVNEVLVGQKGLRLYDISRLVGYSRTAIARYAKGDYISERLTERILAFKERLERPVTIDI